MGFLGYLGINNNIMTKSEIIDKLKQRCNGYDLPLSLNLELVAEILTESSSVKNDDTSDRQLNLADALFEKIIKILSERSAEQHNPIVKNFIKNTIDDINNEVFEEMELFKKYEYQYNLSNGVVVTETLPCNLLNEFFNSKSDSNKYLTASQQEDLENEFSEYVKSISYAL